MTNRRAKAYATATVLGLGALGGAALGSNPGMPVATTNTQGASGASAASVVTSASGATAAVGTEATRQVAVNTRAPIVTRASGASAGTVAPSDD